MSGDLLPAVLAACYRLGRIEVTGAGAMTKMVQIKCNGKRLEVREIGPVIYEVDVLPDTQPLPILDLTWPATKAKAFIERLKKARGPGTYVAHDPNKLRPDTGAGT